MKYMQNGGFQNNPLMKLTIGLTLVFVTGLWVTNLCLYFSKMGLTPESVTSYYLGNEAEFTSPRSFQSLLEVSHFHLPMMAMVILLLTHLLIFAPFTTAAKVAFIVTAFAAGFLNEGSSWLVRFVSPAFAYLKIICFVTFQAVLAFLIVSLAWFLASSPSQGGPRRRHPPGHRTDN